MILRRVAQREEVSERPGDAEEFVRIILCNICYHLFKRIFITTIFPPFLTILSKRFYRLEGIGIVGLDDRAQRIAKHADVRPQLRIFVPIKSYR